MSPRIDIDYRNANLTEVTDKAGGHLNPVVIKVAAEECRHFDTGARRSKDADETRYDLITPIGLEAVAKTYAEGAEKYSDFNWERGMPVHDLLNHAIRHVYKYLSGDRSEDHLPHAAWNLLAAVHSELMWPHLNKDTLRGRGCTPPSQDKDSTK